MTLDANDPRFQMIQVGCVAADNDVLITMVSCSIAELAIRYGSETVENLLTEMLMGDEFHELTAKAREERTEFIEVADMQAHDIVGEATAILEGGHES
jgi:hypothetical protein